MILLLYYFVDNMERKPLFSMVVIAKNEEETLPQLLNSLKEFIERGGEIVVLDTGSTDNTISVAKNSNCRVFTDDGRENTQKIVNTWHYTLRNIGIDETKFFDIFDSAERERARTTLDINRILFDYGAARKAAVRCTSNDYVFCPDCDEYWKTLDINLINSLINYGYARLKISLVYTSMDGHPVCETSREKYFDRRYFEWKWRIHEAPERRNSEISLPSPSIKTGSRQVEQYATIDVNKSTALLYHTQHPTNNRQWYLQQMCGLYLESLSCSTSCFHENTNQVWGDLSSQHHFWFARELKLNNFFISAIHHLKSVYKRIDTWNIEAAAAAMYIGDIYISLNNEDSAKKWWWKGYYKAPGTREAIGRLLRFAYNNDNKSMAQSLLTLMRSIKGCSSYLREGTWYTNGDNSSSYTAIIGYWAFYYGDDIDKQRAKEYWELASKIDPNNEDIKRNSMFFE